MILLVLSGGLAVLGLALAATFVTLFIKWDIVETGRVLRGKAYRSSVDKYRKLLRKDSTDLYTYELRSEALPGTGDLSTTSLDYLNDLKATSAASSRPVTDEVEAPPAPVAPAPVPPAPVPAPAAPVIKPEPEVSPEPEPVAEPETVEPEPEVSPEPETVEPEPEVVEPETVEPEPEVVEPEPEVVETEPEPVQEPEPEVPTGDLETPAPQGIPEPVKPSQPQDFQPSPAPSPAPAPEVESVTGPLSPNPVELDKTSPVVSQESPTTLLNEPDEVEDSCLEESRTTLLDEPDEVAPRTIIILEEKASWV